MKITISVAGQLVDFHTHEVMVKNVRHDYTFEPLIINGAPTFLEVNLATTDLAHARTLYLGKLERKTATIGEINLVCAVTQALERGEYPQLQDIEWAVLSDLVDVRIEG